MIDFIKNKCFFYFVLCQDCCIFANMEWIKLISNKRFGQEHKHAERHDDPVGVQTRLRQAHLLVGFQTTAKQDSGFPLAWFYLCTQPTDHSLEVSSVGMSVGNDISKRIIEKRPELKDTLFEEIGTIVSAACLAHDLGNPPFGHSGEKAIQTFFSEGAGKAVKELVSPEFWQDITHFEGNANAFRILTHQSREGVKAASS